MVCIEAVQNLTMETSPLLCTFEVADCKLSLAPSDAVRASAKTRCGKSSAVLLIGAKLREAIILLASFVIVLAALVWCLFDKFETGA